MVHTFDYRHSESMTETVLEDQNMVNVTFLLRFHQDEHVLKVPKVRNEPVSWTGYDTSFLTPTVRESYY